MKNEGFWTRVADELEYQGKPRKWLAAEVNIDVSTIGNGIKTGATPRADVAIKIANLLEIPVEHLVFGKMLSKSERDIQLYNKYEKFINNIESMSEEVQTSLFEMVQTMYQNTIS